MGIETSAPEVAQLRSWERDDGLGEGGLHGSYLNGTVQGGFRRGRTGWALLGTDIFQVSVSRLWRVARSLQCGASPRGNGEDHAQLLSLARSRGGLADGKLVARAGCSRQANNTSGRRSGGQQQGQLPLQAVTLGCQSLQKSLGMSWRGAGTTISPPSAVHPPCHHTVSCFPVPAGPGCHRAGPRAVPLQQMSQQRGFFLLKSCLAAYGNNKSSIIFNGEADGLDDWFDF